MMFRPDPVLQAISARIDRALMKIEQSDPRGAHDALEALRILLPDPAPQNVEAAKRRSSPWKELGKK